MTSGVDWLRVTGAVLAALSLVALIHLTLVDDTTETVLLGTNGRRRSSHQSQSSSSPYPPPPPLPLVTPSGSSSSFSSYYTASSSSAATLSQPSLKIRFPRTSRRLPQAIIIGVRKCGTRALLEMLYLHPGVQKAAGEVHFFDRDENYNKGLDWYRKKMPHSFRGQITIEKSPSYFVTPEVPERMRAMNSSVKLLLIVREPVTRAISDYTQLRSHGGSAPPLVAPNAAASNLASQVFSNSRSFEELAIKPDGSVNAAYRPLALSLYHTFMHRWLEVFPRQQLLVVNGDRLIEDPVSELEKIETFLGLEHRIGRHNFYFNRTKGFYCLRNDTQDKCLRDSKGRRHPRVDPKVLGKLRRFYFEHNQKFYELVGEDLGWPEK